MRSFLWDVNIYLCPNFDGCLTKTTVDVRPWVITNYYADVTNLPFLILMLIYLFLLMKRVTGRCSIFNTRTSVSATNPCLNIGLHLLTVQALGSVKTYSRLITGFIASAIAQCSRHSIISTWKIVSSFDCVYRILQIIDTVFTWCLWAYHATVLKTWWLISNMRCTVLW